MSETVSAKRWITQIIAAWIRGSWAGNSKCPTPIRVCEDCQKGLLAVTTVLTEAVITVLW